MKALLPIVLSLICLSSFAQRITIQGKVLDTLTEEPIPLAKIFIQNTTNGSTTDFEGVFSLKNVSVKDSIVIRATEYKSKVIVVGPQSDNLLIYLTSETQNIEEILIEAPDEKPSTLLHKKIVQNKKSNDKDKLDAYEYESYNKIQLDINNLGQKFEDRKIVKRVDLLDDFIISDSSNKRLPAILAESFSNFYFKSNPKKKKEVMLASRVTGIDNLQISQFTGEMYQDINVYDNYMGIFDKSFISPIANNAMLFYKFYLTDSAYIGDNWCYKLEFTPKKKGDLTFIGDMWINDSTFAVKSWNARVNGNANLNFVSDFYLEQDFSFIDHEAWIMNRDLLIVDFNLSKGGKTIGFTGKKLTSRRKIKINQIYDSEFYQTKDNVAVSDIAKNQTTEFWEENRHEPLTKTEEGIETMIDSLNTNPFFKFLKNSSYMLTTGFYPIGKMEIGNYQSLISFNQVEGIRNQLDLRTSNKFSKRLEFSGKLAYGHTDEIFKYGTKIRFNVTPKKRGMLTLSYNYDLEQIGQAPTAAEVGATFGALLRVGPLDKLTFVERVDLSFEKDIRKDFIFTSGLIWKEYTPINLGLYQRELSDGSLETINTIRTSELLLKLRYAKNEEFLAGSFDRSSLGSRWPILSAQAIIGAKDALGSDYNYQKLEAQVIHKPRIGFLGKLHYNVYGGYVFGTAAYPFLKVHEGSQSIYLQSAAYNMMDFFEFISDKYVGAHIEHHFNGLILDRVPLVRKLKWRTVGNFRTVYGEIDDRHRAEMILPEGTKTFDNTPYMETGIGIENIFNLLRIDAVWRLTHLSPGENPFGIRAKVSVTF